MAPIHIDSLFYGSIINAPMFAVFFIVLLISLCLLYPLRYKRNSLLLFIDIAFSIIYAFGFSYIIYIFGLDIFRSPFLFFIVLFYVVILGIILLIAKILKLVLSLDRAPFLKKIFIHGIIILFLTALFTISFLYVV